MTSEIEKQQVADPTYRLAKLSRMHRKAVVNGNMTLPAVPSMLEEYVQMCDGIFKQFGVIFTNDQLDHFRGALKSELTKAFNASPRSEIVIRYECPTGLMLNYTVAAQWQSLESRYETWVTTRKPPLFGTEPDAKIWSMALPAQDPESLTILDIGAGTGRNALPLARRGHPVDAIEMTPKFAQIMRDEALQEAINVRVIERSMFAPSDDLRHDYWLIILSEVVSDFRTTDELLAMFTLAAQSLAKGGHLVFNAFLTKPGFEIDEAARQLGQQCYTSIFTRKELGAAAAGLPLKLVSDDSVYEFEKANLPAAAWPPTGWYEGWVSGQDVFDVEREMSPVELRWLVFQKM